MDSPTPVRGRLLWHALAGLGTGSACTIATAPFATGAGCDASRLAWSLAICTPLLAVLPPLVASHRGLGRGGAATISGVLAVLVGALNAVVVWVVTEILAGGVDVDEIGVVLLFSLPFGGIPGAGFSLPLAAATWFTRARLQAPAGAIGASRGLLLVVAIVGAATSTVVVQTMTAQHATYMAWPFVLAFDVAVGLACLAVAARDAWLALRIHDLASDRTGAIEIVETSVGAPPPGLPHVIGGASPRRRPVQILRGAVQDPGPYRTSRARTPILSLAAPPPQAIGALIRRVVLLVACAAVLGWSATAAPRLAPEVSPTCQR